MTTLTIEIPDNATADIASIVKERGGNILSMDIDDENLSEDELESIKRGLKEALLIKEGKLKSIPFSELWND